MTESALTVDRVVVRYGSGEPVLKEVSLAVAPGEFIALLGSSGCGKTTLLRAVSGFAPVSAGRVRVAARDITDLPPDKRDMAMVFQSYALWPHMTVDQNIGYGLKLRGQGRAEVTRRTGEMLAMLDLQGLGARKVTQLSGGQRQRVALGRALAVNPRILLLDEPLSNLDARIRQTVRHEIKALQSRLGITTIHVTHDREEAMVMADRIIILDQGRLVQQGAPEQVYNRPASPFVASFMGADNIVALQVRRDAATVRVAAGEHNDAAALPLSTAADTPGVFFPDGADGLAAAHFRSEAARLVADGQAPEAGLTLRGRVTQSSYPGGFYRYAVDVGAQRFMVDDPRRLEVGAAVGVCLPAATLNLYPTCDSQ